jgi:threonyl-tRNA synthetase
MHGLIRVRQFTISEGHLVIRPDQLADEFRGCLELAKDMLSALGLWEDCYFRFSQWDPNRTDKYEGTKEQWDTAQSVMGELLDELLGKGNYAIGIDEAAFYGPKLDIQMRNVHGKEDTLVTIQIDMLLAKKFGMEYTDSNDERVTPYIIHRTSMGCYERTLALLLEKYAGALPMWIAPEQIRLLPIGDEQEAYARALADRFEDEGLRVSVDARNEKIGYKIRAAQLEKIPYMLVIGEKEMNDNAVAVRSRKTGDIGVMSADEFLAFAKKQVSDKALDN